MSNEGMEIVLRDLRKFVQAVTEGRDPSHGYDHMNEVASRSYQIWLGEQVCSGAPRFSTRMHVPPILVVMAAALLHDVPDHKYDADGALRASVLEYLEGDPHLGPMTKTLMWIIDNISWSKEQACGGTNLLQYKGTVIGYARDIVSDADKSCALGKEGFKRTIEYTRNKLGVTQPEELKILVRKHAEEKLLRLLPDGYFRTLTGRARAQALHDELEQLVAEM